MNALTEPMLIFTCDFDAQTAFEVEQKGWFEQAVVRLPNGIDVPVSFWDPARLTQDLETDVEHGAFCLAEPGMIIVPKVTKTYMAEAVKQLFEGKYFERLLSLGESGGSRVRV